MKKNFDFVAIGDITTDAFIRIKDASVNCDVNREKCQLCFRFGDKVPYESVTVVPAVGNSANAAVSASRLGISSALVSNIGDDQNGEDCLDSLKHNGVATDFVAINAGKKTNYHYVMWFEDERTILIKHEDFRYDGISEIGSPKWIYLSSLGQDSLLFHHRIAQYAREHPEINVAFQPGTFQMKFGHDKLREIYEIAKIFFCNVSEAQRILQTQEHDPVKLMEMMRKLGPKIVVITDGPKGAYAYDGKEAWFMPPYPDPKPPYERTGAGDAFSSTFTVALALGKSIPDALRWGPINSMSVVQKVGAQAGLLSRPELEKFLAEAPEWYTPKKLSI